MTTDDEAILTRAREIIGIEAQALEATAARLGAGFANLVRAVLENPGKVLTSGVGKSGIVAKKMAATLSSTGTPSFYLNPVNALHGDLGIAGQGDFLIALSNSGETQEILDLVQTAKTLRIAAAAFTGVEGSTLWNLADFPVDVGVEREACPLGLAPTASTTACLAAGDALALILMEARGFSSVDFRKFHPGGRLGKRLELHVRDIMRTGERLPVVGETAPLHRAIAEMSSKETIGVTLVTGNEGRLSGVLTDGDLRRVLERETDPGSVLERPVKEFMSASPKVVEAASPALEALRIMEVKGITSLAIVDTLSRPVGLIHLHDILGRGHFSF